MRNFVVLITAALLLFSSSVRAMESDTLPRADRVNADTRRQDDASRGQSSGLDQSGLNVPLNVLNEGTDRDGQASAGADMDRAKQDNARQKNKETIRQD